MLAVADMNETIAFYQEVLGFAPTMKSPEYSIVARDGQTIHFMKAASEGAMKNVLSYSDGPLVSSDFNHNPHSSIFDATCTKVSGRLVKVCSWYDNEWGFSNRMLDTTVALMGAK